MNEKEKIQFKLEILKDLQNTLSFDFMSLTTHIEKHRLDELINNYEEKIKFMNEKGD